MLLSVEVIDVSSGPKLLPLEPTSLGPGTLSIDGNVLKVEDLTGGTTAIASTRRLPLRREAAAHAADRARRHALQPHFRRTTGSR